MQASPLTIVKERFQNKEGLVKAVQKLASDELWLERVNEDKGLTRASNRKLLHLHDVLSTVKEQFGSRAKLVDAIAEMEKRAKDDGFKQRLQRYPTPRLWDAYRSAKKRAK